MGKKWGMKTAWAKSFFLPEFIPVAAVHNLVDAVQVEEKGEKGQGGSASRALRVNGKGSDSKGAVAASWRCTRCGSVLGVPTNAHTGRPSFLILAEHLEGVSSSGTAPITGVEPCRAGLIRYAPNSDPHSSVSDVEGKKALDALQQLLFGESTEDCGMANNDGSGEFPVRVFVAVENPKTPANLGGILRAIGCFGFSGLIFSGTRLLAALKHRPVTDTQAAGFSSPYVAIPDMINLFEVLEGATSFETVVVAVDMIDGATPLPLYRHPCLHALDGVARKRRRCTLPNLVVYLFGPEDGSIRQEVIARCHSAVFLPTQGSLNLAAAVNVVLYDRCAAQWRLTASDEDVAAKAAVAASRDAAARCLRSRNANNRTSWCDPHSVAVVVSSSQSEKK
ncbi:hypothetical protein MOQ_008134 [Trypanosoma cruzi marinkellei]|uniref:tRNA/rRNA methyltransferase SpoU type domain-containing protein n=1 Tax=Trypanosoma cruzi marinkellei TaxID=85056 RepID=K2NGR2_TRYCR|nr:hypothetical protein MOQ_008134 [Trypanosoma cruzi marinkellei]